MTAKPETETKDFKFSITDVDKEEGTFTGYASIWDEVDSYNDQVIKGAFKRSLKSQKAFPMLWSHDVREPIGVIRAKEDDVGLAVEGDLNLDIEKARDVRSQMIQSKKAGIPMGLSIGFQTVIEELDKASGIRKLKEIKLWEISVVLFPALEPARVDSVKTESAALRGDETGGPGTDKDECKALPGEDPAKATPLEDPQSIKASPDHVHLAKQNRKTIAEFIERINNSNGT